MGAHLTDEQKVYNHVAMHILHGGLAEGFSDHIAQDSGVGVEIVRSLIKNKELKPAYLADADSNRALLDRRVVCELLGFDEDVYEGVRRLSAKWCAEPSVHGGKARPKAAQLMI